MTPSNSSNKSGPSTLADRALNAWHERGMIFVRFASGHEVSFPTKGNPRLESAAEEDVGCIEISPFGLHWPTLDEDLSFAGILRGVTVNDDSNASARWGRAHPPPDRPANTVGDDVCRHMDPPAFARKRLKK